MSDLFDDLDFEMLGGDFEDPFENEPVDPVPPPVPGMPNAGHQPVQHPKAAVQKASEADCTEGPAQHRILAPPVTIYLPLDLWQPAIGMGRLVAQTVRMGW